MPTNNSWINNLWNGKPNGEPYSKEVREQSLKSLDPSRVDVAEVNASKELGRLAVYILKNFPHLVGEGKKPVDLTIELLDKAYNDLGPAKDREIKGTTVKVPVESVFPKE